MSNWKVGPGGRIYHPTTGAYVGQLDDNGNEQMVVTASPSGTGAVTLNVGGVRTDILTAAEAEASRIINRMSVLPTQARRGLITAFVGAMINADVWDRLDALYVMAAHDAQAGRINWRGAGAQDLVNVNGAAFTTDRGFAGDGATSYLDTGLAGNAADNYSRDSGFAAIWSLTDTANNNWNDISGGGGLYINARAVSGSAAARCNNSSAAASAAAVPSAIGLFATSRQASDTFDFYRNGTLLVSPSIASEALTGTPFYIGRNATNYSGRRLGLAAIGAGLTPAQYQAFYAAAAAYMTAVGA